MGNILDSHLKAYRGESLYDFDNEVILKWYPRRIKEFCKESDSMLELGLGHGFTTDSFSQFFSRHVVLDGSPAVIERFKDVFPQCRSEIIETYFEDFYTDEKFDVIMLGFVLEHVDNPVQILKHVKQFLALNGKIFLAVPNADSLNRRLGHSAGMLPDTKVLSENDVLLGHKRYYTVETLAKDINNAGYKVDLMEGIYLKPFTTKQILSLELEKSVIDALCEVGVEYPELSCGILAKVVEDK